MRIFALLLSGLILALVKDGQARSVEGSLQCATTCADPVMMSYSTGSSHEFTYDANVQHSFNTNAGPDQTSQLSLQVNFRIDVLAPCEHVLTVTQAYIDNGDLDQWQDALMQNPLHFSYQDGTIPSVCAANNDPTWVLNIKRGILSSLQVSTTATASAVPETDVTGECEVDYSVDENSAGVVITKVKDYSKCVGRQQELMFSHFTPFNTGDRQDFVNSYQQCTQRLTRGQILGTECHEKHTFRPFSNEESGAQTTIRSTVTRTGSRRNGRVSARVASSHFRRTTLGFEKDTQVTLSQDITEIRAVFDDICQTLDTEHYQQVGKDFIKLVFLLRHLDAPAIEQAYSSLRGACNSHNDALKGMFVDALQWCGSEGCVVFSTTLIASGPEELDDATAFRWLFGMSLITKPTLPMLDGLTNVVASGRFVEQSYLTSGTMIQKICVDQPNCLAAAEITRALGLFESKLGVNCRTSDMEQKQQILLALRAIGNAGRSNSVSILSQCARETQNDMDTRVAAIQAFRRMPCGTDRSLTSIFFDEEDDSEARINAYLSLMQCPTARFIQQVKAMLKNEPVLQVSNFVWSHLKEIAESNDPLKGYMKPLLIDLILTPPHELDPRKYSRFYEASFYSEGLNAGATVESSLIWSPKSFVPRSAGLNMTVDIFGQAVNLFEIGGRVEGVESFVKSMLQSESFKSSPIGKIFVTEEDEEEVEEQEFTTDIDVRSADAAKVIEVSNEFKRGMPEEKSSASWFLRVFGNEMFYGSSQFEKDVADEIAESSQIRSIIAQIAQGKAYNYHDDMLIVNSAHILPTGVGLPLELAFNGSVSIDLNVQGQFDMSGLFSTSPALAFKADVNPRATIVFNGAMSVDAHVTRSGIQTESTSLTSWKIGGRASMDRGQSVSVQIDTPYDRNTVVNFDHKLMKIVGDNIVDFATAEDVAVVSDCTSDFAGHRLCLTQPSVATIDSIVFPSSGAVSYSVHAEKTDADLTHFLFTGNYEIDFESGYIPRELQVNARFETPGSIVDRTTQFNLGYDLDSMSFTCSLRHPDLAVQTQAKLINEANKKRAMLSLSINEDAYEFQGGVKREVDGKNKEWTLDSSLALPSLEQSINFDATLAYTPSSSLSLESRLENAMSEPIVFNTRINNLSNARKQKLRFEGSGEVNIPTILDSSYRFDFNFRPKTDVYQVTLDYTIGSNDEESVKVQYKLKDKSNDNVSQWSAEHVLTSTQFPSFNHDIELKYKKSDELVSSSVEVQYGAQYKKKDNQKKVVVKQAFGYASSSQLHGNMEIEVPELGIDNKIDFNFKSNDTAVDMGLGYNGIKFGIVAIDRSEDLLNKAFNLYVNADDVQTPVQSIKLETYIEETSSDVYQLGGDFSIGKTKDMAITAKIDVENLAYTKSIRFDASGKNDVLLLAGHSVHTYAEPATYTSKNGFTYGSNSVQLNGQYEGQKEGGFETNIEYRMNQNTYAALNVDFESNENAGSKLIKITYKDAAGRDKFAQVEATTNSQENAYTATAEFTTDMSGLPFQSLQLNLNTETSASSFNGDVNAVLDSNEILGFGAAYQNSDATTVDLTARQRLSTDAPQDYAFKVAHSVARSGDMLTTISYSHTQDSQESDVVAELNLGSSEYSLQVSQSFSEEMPESTKFTVSLPGGNRLNTELAFSDNVFTLGGSFSASSLNLDFSQEGPLLEGMPVPSTLNSVMSWGTRQGDNKQGLWIVTSVDDSQTMTVEFMFEGKTPEVSAKMTHNIQSLMNVIPQVALIITPVVDMSDMTVALSLTLDVNENRMLACNINRESDSVLLNFEQTFTSMIPQKLEFKGQGHWSGFNSADFETSFLYDESETKLSGELASGMVKVTYLSDCEWMRGDVDVQLDFSGSDNSFLLTYTNTGVEKTASGSYTYDGEAFETGFVFSQNLFSNENNAMIPGDISGSIGYTEGEISSMSFDGKYNDYSINAIETWTLVGSKYVCNTKLQQNIFSAVNTLTARQEIDMNPFTSFDYSITYSFDRRPQATVGLALSTGENDDGTVTVSAEMTQTEQFFSDNEVPESVNVGLTYPSDLSAAAPKIALTLAVGSGKSLNLDLSGDWSEKEIRFAFSQNGYIEDFTSTTYSLKATVPSDMGANAQLALDQELTINDDSYQVGLSGGYSFNMDASTVTLDLGMTQTIPMLLRYSVPSSLETSTTAHYGFDQSMAGQSTFEITISRTMTDPDNGDQAEYSNTINTMLELELFSHLAFTLSHDFGADSAIPENVKVDITASGSDEEANVVNKSLKFTLTLDGNEQKILGTVDFNPAERTFYLSTSHDFEDLLYIGVPEETSVSFRMANDYDIDLKLSSDDYQKRIGFEFDLQTENYMLKFNAYHDFDFLENTLMIPKQFGVATETSIKASTVESELSYVWGDLTNKAHVESRWNFASNTPSFDVAMTQDMVASTTFPQQVSAQFNVRSNNNVNLNFMSSVGGFTITCNGNMVNTLGATGSLQFSQTFTSTPFQSFNVRAGFDFNDVTAASLSMDINVDNNDLLEINLQETTDVNDMSTLVKLSATQSITDTMPSTIDLSVSGNVAGTTLTTDVKVSIDGGKAMTVSFNTGVDMDKKSGFLELNHGQKKWSKKMNIPRTARLEGALSQNPDGNQLVIKLKRGRTKEKITINFNSALESDSLYVSADYTNQIPELNAVIPASGAVAFFGQGSWTSVVAKLNVTLGETDFKHALEASYKVGDSTFGYDIEFKQDNKYLNSWNVPALVASAMHLDWADAYSGSISGTFGDDYVTLSLSSNLKNKANLNLNFNVASVSHDLTTTVTVAGGQANLVINWDGDVQEATLSAAMSEGYARVGFNHDFAIPVPKDVTGSVTWQMDPNVYVMVNVTVDGHPYSVSSSFKRLENNNENGFYAALTLFNIVREITFLQDVSESKVSMKLNHNIDEIINYVPGTVALDGGLENGALNLGLTVDGTEYTFAGEADLQQMKLSYEHNIDSLPLPKVMAIQVGGSMEPLHGKMTVTVNDNAVALEGKLDSSSAMLSASHNFRSLPIPRVMSAEVGWGANPITGMLAIKYDDRLVDISLDVGSNSGELKMTQNILSDVPASITLSGDLTAESSSNVNGQLSLVIDDNNAQLTLSMEDTTFKLALTHDFVSIPIPAEITFTETYTVAPYGCQMALNYGDNVYTIGGELDLTEQRISANQNIPELNALGVPSQVSLQVKGSMTPLSGELLVSIDGAENRIAAGLDTDKKAATFSQDFGYGFPEDIELTLSGSLSPLSGRIALSVDGLNRAVAVDGSDMQYEIKHSVPEMMNYVPEAISFRLSFTDSSFNANAGFTMDGTTASYAMSGSFDENHLSVNLHHNCEFLPLPENMEVSLAGSAEFKNASVNVAFGDSNVNMNGDIMTGEGEGWYGAAMALTHNVPQMMDFGIPMNNDFSAKGKFDGSELNVEGKLECGSLVSYEGVASASFSFEDSIQIQGKYEHMLNSDEFSCNTALAIDYSNPRSPSVRSTTNYVCGEERNSVLINLSADLSQPTLNSRLTVRVRDDNSNEYIRGDQISINFDMETLSGRLTVNQPELNQLGVPAESTMDITMPDSDNGRTFSVNAHIGDLFIGIGGSMPQMAWSNFEINGRFVQNMCDWMPQNTSTTLRSSYDIIDNVKFVSEMGFEFTCDETSINWTRELSLSQIRGKYHSESITNIPAWATYNNEVSDFAYSMSRGRLNVDLSNSLNDEAIYTFNLQGSNKGDAAITFDLFTPYRVGFASSVNMGKKSAELHSNLNLFNQPLYNLDIASDSRRMTSSFDFSLADLNGESSIDINCMLKKGTVSMTSTNNGYSPYLADKLAFELLYLENPLALTFTYNEDTMQARLQYNSKPSMGGSLNVEQTLCDYMPRAITAALQFATPRSFNVQVVADGVTLFITEATADDFTSKVNDLENNNLFTFSGSYSLNPSVSNLQAELAVPPVEFAYGLDFTVSMFEQGTGENTISLKVANSNTEEQITFDLLARPTEGGHAADFYSKVEVHSTYLAIPLDMVATLTSDYEPSTSAWSYDFEGTVNEKTMTLIGKVNHPDTAFSLNAKQGFSDSMITFLDVDVTTNSVSDFEQSAVTNIAWDDFDATITASFKAAADGYIHTNIVHPGCTMYNAGCSDMTFNVDWQVAGESADNDAALQAKVLIDEAKFLISATYNKESSHHKVNLDMNQNIFETFPYQTDTVIDVLAQGSMFSFEGRMDSPSANLITLSENFSMTNGALSNELLYKLFTSDLTYFKSDIKATYDGAYEIYTNAQVNSMPEMSALARFDMSGSNEDGVNNTVTVTMKSGPLSKFLGFRRFSSGVWYQQTAEGEQFFLPKFGGKVNIDSDIYFLSTTSSMSADAVKGKYEVNLSVQHPHDATVLGYKIPKAQDLSFNLFRKGYAGKMAINYKNDLMSDEIRLSNKLRLFKGQKLVELSMTSVYDHVLPYTIEFNVEQSVDGFDYIVSGTLQLKTMIDVDYAFGVVNSDEKIGFDVTVTNKLSEKTHQVSGYYMYADQTLLVDIVTPGREPIHLRGDLKQLISQVRDAISRIMTEATSSSMNIVKGIASIESGGYDMYIGYSDADDSTYTLHLVLTVEPKLVSAALQIKENFKLDSEIASVSISVPEGRSIKIEMSANPTLANFIQDTLFALNGEFSQKASWAANNVNDILSALKTVVTGNDEVEDYTSTYIDQAIGRVNTFRDIVVSFISSTTTEVSEGIQSSEAKTQKMIKNGLGVAVTYISTLNDFIATPFKELVEEYYQVELASVIDFVDEQLNPIKDILDKVNVGDAFIALVNEVIDNALYFVTRNGEATLISTRIPLKDLIVVTNSQILITIPLQFEIDHFVPLPTLSDIEGWFTQTAMAVKINEALEVLFSYADDYYRARALLNMPADQLLPPFKGHAFVSGFRHFSTFDQRTFDYVSDCGSTHVLAADMKTGNFSVSLTYADPLSTGSQNSINVMTGGANIVMNADYSVSVDGKIQELPHTVGEVMVSREGNAVHVRRSDGDLDVACDFMSELCTIDISPYYFGATAGLAGIYNNEPNDDFTGKSHEKFTDVSEFASSWEVSPVSCSSRNTNQNCENVHASCQALFEDMSSPFRPCFAMIDPAPYMQMCADSMCNTNDESKACAASAAYQHRCGLVGAILEKQPSCVVCSEINGNTFTSSETREAKISGADVVFVVEEGECLAASNSKSFKRVFKKLASELQGKKLDTTFQFVGFGGVQDKPHSYTVGQDLMINKKHLQKTLKRVSKQSTVSSSGDALAAISYASQLQFRSGAKPIIILISCDECSQSSQVTVPQVQSQLERSGISFHHFNMQPIVQQSSPKLYGYNNDFVFDSANTKSSVTTLTRDEVTDQCAILATSSGGSVWHGDHVTREANFSNSFGTYIANVVDKRRTHTCTCALNDAGIATATCTM